MSKHSLPEVLLAPMAGITDAATRSIAIRFGAPLGTTEMVSAKGLIYGNKHTKELLRRMNNETSVIVQIFGRDTGAMREGAAQIQDMLDGALFGIDINFGCPAPKIFRNGEGAALMQDPATAAAVVRAVRDAVSCPVGVKIRSGVSRDQINAVPFARRMEDAGADWITVHPRTRDQYYSGRADWNVIREVAGAVHVPVIGNGDVTTPEDALRMRETTKCDAVMIGRGAIGNPFLFDAIRTRSEGREYRPPSSWERISVLKEHIALCIAERGEQQGVRVMRAQIPRYLGGMHGACAMRSLLNTLNEPEAVYEALDAYAERLSGWEEHPNAASIP